MAKNWRGMVLLLLVGSSFAANAPETNVLRWAENLPGCTFTADDDGRYRYGLWTSDLGVVLTVDSQEMQKSLRRTKPTFAVLLTVHYRGKSSLAIDPSAATLEFVKHFHEVRRTLDPQQLATSFQAETDNFAQRITRDIQKHPEKKASLESELEENRQSTTEMLTFLRTRSLHPATLDAGHASTDGWIYFDPRGKWINEWEKQEEFVLRIPLGNQILEFPFALPQSQNDLRLRRR